RYRVEIEFDTLNKKINIAEKLGTDKGVYFMDSLNLKNLNIQGNSYDFYTRIIAKGKEDLKVIVENHQYSNKTKTLIWKDERYTDEASLREDATAKLKELSKPYRAYSADILDLANMSQKYKDILEYSLGDTITLISKENGIREKQRLVTIREYPDEPQRNTCEIANTTLKFEDIQKEQQDTTDTVNNITEDNGTISSDAVKGAFTVLNKLNVNEINALKGQFGEFKVNKLDVDVANIKFAEIDKAVINKADVTQLNAVSAKINVLEADSATIKTLVAGNITAENIQSNFLQTLQGWMLEGSIGNAQISDLNANKIRSGTVDTSLVTVAGPGGRL
ncbi:phage tail spike protein, partial [Clostridium cadaveris]|uniref:phage tail spike protein n=2 Tax=Clostridium TaxID=1485 RepID=UPI0039926570